MGYQEAYKPIKHLAEAAGIREAVEAYKDNPDIPGDCVFYCATKSKDKCDENGAPRLYACVGGDRCVSMRVGHFSFDPPLDWVYADHFEDLDNSLLDEAASARPDLVASARAEATRDFESLVKETRQWREKLDCQYEELRPKIERYLAENGSVRRQDMFNIEEFAGYSELHNVIDMLVWDGVLEEVRSRRTQRLKRYKLAHRV